MIHATQDVGRPKVESARDAIARLNPNVVVEPHALRLDETNARALIGRYDVVADGSDNFATRYLVSDACYYERRPLVTAALGGFDASLTTLRPFERGPDAALIRPIAACFRRRRWRGKSRPAKKPAFSARLPEWSAR